MCCVKFLLLEKAIEGRFRVEIFRKILVTTFEIEKNISCFESWSQSLSNDGHLSRGAKNYIKNELTSYLGEVITLKFCVLLLREKIGMRLQQINGYLFIGRVTERLM